MRTVNWVWTRDVKIYWALLTVGFAGSPVIFLAIDGTEQEACIRLEVCLGSWLEVPWCLLCFLKNSWDRCVTSPGGASCWLLVVWTSQIIRVLTCLGRIPFYKLGCVILINTGTICSLHHTGWALFYSRPVKIIHVTLPGFWSLRPTFLAVNAFHKPETQRRPSTSAFPLVYFCYPCPHPPCFSAINEFLLSYSDIQPDSMGE